MRTSIIYFIIGLLVATIAVPALAGIWSILTANGNNVISPTASIGLAILATALSGVLLWFVKNPLANGSYLPATWRLRSSLEYAGKLLLFAAFCFTILGVLAPVMPSDTTDLAPMEVIIKVVSSGSIMLGTTSLIVSVCMGIVLIWVRKL
jgi:hypothetical protein